MLRNNVINYSSEYYFQLISKGLNPVKILALQVSNIISAMDFIIATDKNYHNNIITSRRAFKKLYFYSISLSQFGPRLREPLIMLGV